MLLSQAIFEPSYHEGLRRLEEEMKSNDDAGRLRREDAIRANHDLGFGGWSILGRRRLTFRVKAGREVVT